MTEPVEAVLAAEGVRKRFGVTQAVADCDMHVAAGEVHGLVGANGAGKSTLVKILSGALAPDEGRLRIGSWEGATLNPRLAQELGIATIYQDPDLVPTLATAENIALGRERRRGGLLLHRRAERRDALAIAERVGLQRRLLGRPVGDLSRADQQLVEIAKALHRRARAILMDEPTAPLGPADIERLARVIRDLAADGVAIVYISHRLREVLGVCDRVTVMRDGRHVWTRQASTLGEGEIVLAMIGHGLVGSDSGTASAAGDVVLDVRGLRQGSQLTDVSLQVRTGEVVGLAGLVGAGRSRLLKVLAGETRADGGEITVGGRAYRPSTPAQAIRRGVGLLPEDRKRDGLFLDMSVAKNIAFVRPPRLLGALVRRRDEHAVAQRWIRRLRIVPSAPGVRVASLSGGNQQKALIARWLHADVDLLLVDEPGQGVDVHGKDEIVKIIRETAAAGKAILVSSSETEELLALADRVLVMRQGRIVGELERRTISEERIVALASGAETGTSHG
jgi:ABC-type sugar transport system ATPase subunit